MTRITDEMMRVGLRAHEFAPRTDEAEVRAILTAVAPLIEAQVREECAEKIRDLIAECETWTPSSAITYRALLPALYAIRARGETK